eukprot:1456493-Amphidinium_carterae.1
MFSESHTRSSPISLFAVSHTLCQAVDARPVESGPLMGQHEHMLSRYTAQRLLGAASPELFSS